MGKSMDELILDGYPLLDYAEDRALRGSMSFVEETQRRELAEGAVYRECLYRRGDGTDVWTYWVTIAPDAPVQLAVAAAPLRTAKPVKRHAEDFERDFETPVLFAMNASFFHFFRNGDLTPFGIQVVRGVEMSLPAMHEKGEPRYCHNFLAVDREGKAFVCNSDEFYKTWRGKLSYAVGGGFRLMRDGKIYIHADQLGGEFAYAPRTVVGFAADGTTVLMCADGRTKRSGGLCYGDIVEMYLQLGLDIREILNMDGGGSTTVVLRDEDGVHRVYNRPSGPQLPFSYAKYGMTREEPQGGELARSVADTILVIPKEK